METKFRKKLVTLAALSLLSLSSVATLPYVVNAADGTTTKDLVIHKIENGDDTIHENDGDNRPSSLTGNYLLGAGFTVVDVSNDYYNYASSQLGLAPKDIYNSYFTKIKHESNQSIINRGTVVGTEKLDAATGTNSDGTADGQVRFTDLPTKDGSGRNAVYAVIETTRPANNVTTNEGGEVASNVIGTIPTLIAMPLNATSPTINIYPKNEVGKLTKELTTPDDHNVSVAQTIAYNIELKLPRDLGATLESGDLKYSSFTVNEIPGFGLIFNGFDPATTTVFDGTTERTLNDFVAAYSLFDTHSSTPLPLKGDGVTKAGLTFAPNGNSRTGWEQLASKTLTIRVNCSVDLDYFAANPDKILNDINNKANYKVTETNGFEVVPGEDEEKSVTATYKFKKNDSNTGQFLSGAVFAVKRSGELNNSYFKEVGAGSGIYILTNNPSDTQDLRVGADGRLVLLGLDEDLIYELRETQAPAGYLMSGTVVSFTPNRSDDFDQLGELNLHTNDTDGFHNIYNTPENLLPSTGGRGFVIFGLVAAIGLGGASVLYFLKRKNAQEQA